jgi:predicted dehydrogenase
MVKQRLNAAIIGLGRIGAEPSSRFEDEIPNGWLPISHMESFISSDKALVDSICDANLERLNYIGDIYSINSRFTSYSDLFDQRQLSLVSIATRTQGRGDIIDAALKCGVKGFHIEKPIANSLSETKRILNNINEANAKLSYGTTRRAMDVFRYAKEFCYSGEIGDIQHITIEFGKSALLWTLPHATDLICFFANSTEIQNIQGVCTFSGDVSECLIDCDPIVESSFIKFTNGISASINPTGILNVRISCSKGNLTIHGNGYCIEINRRKAQKDYFHSIEVIDVPSSLSGTQHMVQDLCSAVLEERPLRFINPSEIVAGQIMLFGIVTSALNKGVLVKPTDLNEELIVTGRTGNNYA